MATRLPSGNYRAQVFIGKDEKGHRQYKSFTGTTANEADLKALQFKARIMPSNGSNKTLLRASHDFLHMNTKTLSVTTQRGYLSIHRKLGSDYKNFACNDISAIDKKTLQKFLNLISADHAPKTVRNYYGYICRILRANDIAPPECNLPQRKRPILNIPDEQTIKDVFDVVRGTDLEIPVMLAAIVPMRRGEICGASIDDLDEKNILHIHSSLAIGDKGTLNIKAPKTDSSDRFVELPEELADKIRKQGYICNISIKALSKRFSTALKKAGIEHFRFHDLRHAFVSIAHASGIPDAYIMSRGGWATSYTVNNVYRHVLDADRLKIESKVNNKFSEFL